MKQKNIQRGFTLIELLVVVLIIAILAAIALPQYQKAVEKSRVAEAREMLKSMQQAVHVYYLTHGAWPSSLSELDIVIPTSSSFFNYSYAYGSCNAEESYEQYIPHAFRTNGKYYFRFCNDRLVCVSSSTHVCQDIGFSRVQSCFSGATCYVE